MKAFETYTASYPREWRALYGFLPHGKGFCVAIAIARYLVPDPQECSTVGLMAAAIVLRSSDFDRWGCYHGDVAKLGDDLGFKVLRVDSPRLRDPKAKIGRAHCFPTVAWWVRNNPDVTKALFRTTGHVAYFEDGVGYALSPRARVDTVLVLEEKSHE